MEAITPLPPCDPNGRNGPKNVNCRPAKALPICKGNKPEKLADGEEATCRTLPTCLENPGSIPGETCYSGRSSLVQLESHHRHKHHHKHHHKHRDADDSAGADAGQRDNQTEEDQMEAEPALPTCNGSNGAPGVDCLKPKKPKGKAKGLAQISQGRNLVQVTGDDKEE